MPAEQTSLAAPTPASGVRRGRGFPAQLVDGNRSSLHDVKRIVHDGRVVQLLVGANRRHERAVQVHHEQRDGRLLLVGEGSEPPPERGLTATEPDPDGFAIVQVADDRHVLVLERVAADPGTSRRPPPWSGARANGSLPSLQGVLLGRRAVCHSSPYRAPRATAASTRHRARRAVETAWFHAGSARPTAAAPRFAATPRTIERSGAYSSCTGGRTKAGRSTDEASGARGSCDIARGIPRSGPSSRGPRG
jgi:hypothetical protein